MEATLQKAKANEPIVSKPVAEREVLKVSVIDFRAEALAAVKTLFNKEGSFAQLREVIKAKKEDLEVRLKAYWKDLLANKVDADYARKLVEEVLVEGGYSAESAVQMRSRYVPASKAKNRRTDDQMVADGDKVAKRDKPPVAPITSEQATAQVVKLALHVNGGDRARAKEWLNGIVETL